ncbi:MAG: long-chain-fatty-acid--CoA ligase [Geminicoccaceae bacterium]
MLGLMQEQPLLISSLLSFAARHHGDAEIVSNTVEGPRHRYTYRDAERRARRLARAIERLGIRRGDRVGTLAWNGYRHYELYFAVSGMGAVIHTINPRLFDEQIAYIIDHAEDRVLFADLTFVPLLERVLGGLGRSPAVVVMMTDRQHLPEVKLPPGVVLHAYEDLLAEADDGFVWPALDEHAAAALCYTSGTTGPPKGVLYSHRSTVLHAYAINLADVIGLRAADRALPIVAMFHVNAWGIPYAATMVGAALVFAGARTDGASLHDLIVSERVTYAAAVPTVWLGLLQHLRQHGGRLELLERICVGGAACPQLLLEALGEEYGVGVNHGWGMTEMSPVGTYNSSRRAPDGPGKSDAYARRLKQGRAFFGVDMRIVDAAGCELPWDGATSGELLVRGPSICRRYFRAADDATDADGWFRTGDIATIDADGFLQITDRSKDLIKSGGEWISSIELENIAIGHPDVAEAAVIAARHPLWDERPLLLVVAQPGRALDVATVLALFEGKVARHAEPDAGLVVDELPHTATGKLLKTALRERYGDYYLRPPSGTG